MDITGILERASQTRSFHDESYALRSGLRILYKLDRADPFPALLNIAR